MYEKILEKKFSLFLFILLVLIVFVLFLRIWNLDKLPSGFFVDESSIAFNGYTLLSGGTDEFGVSFPTFFKAFGEYKNPLYIYAQVPIFKIFGVTRYSSRLVAALFMICAGGVFALILRDQSKLKSKRLRRIFALIGLLIFLCLPWSFHLGRVVFEVATFPVLLFLAIWLLRKVSLGEAKSLVQSEVGLLHKLFMVNYQILLRNWLAYSFIMGMLFYSYTVARFVSPLLFVISVVLFFHKLKLKNTFLGILIFFVTLMPALKWEITNPGSLLTRYSIVVNKQLSFFDFGNLYLNHFDFNFLFLTGDGNLRHGMIETGQFPIMILPLLIAGFYQLIKKEKRAFSLWIIVGILISPIPGVLTIPSPHTLRSISLLVFLTYLAGLGLTELWKEKKIIILIFLFMLFIESSLILNSYFSKYASTTKVWYENDVVMVLERVIPNEQLPYFFSNELYPGTYVTGYFTFAKATNADLQHIKKSVQTVKITSSFLKELEKGTVFLHLIECEKLFNVLASRFEIIEINNQLCVFTKK